jgi:hypothetical protein
MTTPVDITFRNMATAPLLEEEIRGRAEWLATYHPHLQGCRVVFEVPHRHKRRGRQVSVTIEVTVPEGTLTVQHTHPPNAEQPPTEDGSRPERRHNQEALEAIREAFHIARRSVVDSARRRRGD